MPRYVSCTGGWRVHESKGFIKRNRVVQVLDLCTLLAAYTALALYVIKELNVIDVMKQWRSNPKVSHVSVPLGSRAIVYTTLGLLNTSILVVLSCRTFFHKLYQMLKKKKKCQLLEMLLRSVLLFNWRAFPLACQVGLPKAIQVFCCCVPCLSSTVISLCFIDSKRMKYMQYNVKFRLYHSTVSF